LKFNVNIEQERSRGTFEGFYTDNWELYSVFIMGHVLKHEKEQQYTRGLRKKMYKCLHIL
jgi:hypothetical protein